MFGSCVLMSTGSGKRGNSLAFSQNARLLRPRKILEGGKVPLFHLNLCTGSGSFDLVLVKTHGSWQKGPKALAF